LAHFFLSRKFSLNTFSLNHFKKDLGGRTAGRIGKTTAKIAVKAKQFGAVHFQQHEAVKQRKFLF
jgi:hypothetical protein